MTSQREEFLKIFDSIKFDKIKDHPNIIIAARFWSHERYCAAKIFYRFMRKIDDMTDDYKASHRLITESDRDSFISRVNEWLKMIIISDECNPLQQEIINTIEKFRKISLTTLIILPTICSVNTGSIGLI